MIAGTGFLIEKAEKFMVSEILCFLFRSRLCNYLHHIAVVEESYTTCDHLGIWLKPIQHFNSITASSPNSHFHLCHPAVSLQFKHITKTITHNNSLLLQSQCSGVAEVKFALSKHAGFQVRVSGQIHIH